MPNQIHPSERKRIFVFGSNLAGIHGRGAARDAKVHYGAKIGQGWGLHGKSYAIPTKSHTLVPLSLPIIRGYVDDFIRFVWHSQRMQFNVTKVGCGLAGYKDEEIAPMFKVLSTKDVYVVYFDRDWKPYLDPHAKFWRTL